MAAISILIRRRHLPRKKDPVTSTKKNLSEVGRFARLEDKHHKKSRVNQRILSPAPLARRPNLAALPVTGSSRFALLPVLIGLTCEAEGAKELRVAVTYSLRVIPLSRRLICLQVLQHRLVLRSLLCADLGRNQIAEWSS